ncbi:hypothetical protein CAEBREN_07115 [Caenorhabditis brenneri]|uniref:Uncharacterized protein n=1 Tax=Caenorhabditis brenneri TaxID=135651 RepID=G0P7B3_CAEBE|nr:hypothetical protein CAEBREN_07115 [Caenorhabditis brenneri]
MSSDEEMSGDDEELPQQYEETKMKRLPLSQFQITFEHGCTTMYNNTEKFIGSYCLLDDKKAKSGKYKYFVLDSTDIDCWLAEKKNDEKCLESLDNFMTMN